MRAVDIILSKRDGGTLSREEIRFFVDGVTAGTLPDYQASALLIVIIYVVANLVADILYAVVNPRIRY